MANRDSLAARRRFVVPATTFFVVYYFALPLLLSVSTFYMIAQMVGAGSLVKLLLPGVS